MDSHGIVLFSEDWHPGVVGIVASRVTRKYHRPCIVLGEENGLAKGSGRASTVSIWWKHSRVRRSPDQLGGHPMAVGISLPRANLESFRERFAAAVRVSQRGLFAEPGLEIACWLTLEQIREQLLTELEVLHPFGQGNPEPVFGLRGVRFRQRPEVFKEQHFRFHLEDERGRRVYGVAWKLAHRLPPVGARSMWPCRLPGICTTTRKLLQMELLDWRLSEAG